jgi:hypothetical protein
MATKRKRPSLEQVIKMIREVLDGGDKIRAIKIVRENTDLGLYEAKTLVETYDDGTSCRMLADRWKRRNGTITNGEMLCVAAKVKEAEEKEQPIGDKRRMDLYQFMMALRGKQFLDQDGNVLVEVDENGRFIWVGGAE